MWSIGIYDYGLSNKDFWRLTPSQFHVLGKRFDAGRKASDLGFGIVASVIANTNRDPKKQKEPFKPEDFMPKYGIPKKRSGKALRAYWDTFVRPANATIEKLKKEKHGR